MRFETRPVLACHRLPGFPVALWHGLAGLSEITFLKRLEKALVPCCEPESVPKWHIVTIERPCWGQRWVPKLDRVVETALSKVVSTGPCLDQIFSCHATPHLDDWPPFTAQRECR